MRDPEFAAVYYELVPEFQVAREVIRLRLEKGLTQKEVGVQAQACVGYGDRLPKSEGLPKVCITSEALFGSGGPVRVLILPARMAWSSWTLRKQSGNGTVTGKPALHHDMV